jgi:hypothetical protein
MTRLKRLLWLVAWTFWLWLGFGLYRELPRDLGPEVCRLPEADAGQSFLGFIGGANLPAFREYLPGGRGLEVRVYDAETGMPVRTIRLSQASRGNLVHENVRRHGVVFMELPFDPENEPGRVAWYAADLMTGRREFLTDHPVLELKVASDQPWVAVVERMPAAVLLERVAIFDVRTGKRLFTGATTTPQPRGYLNFLPGSDRLVVPNMSEDRTNVAFDVWSLDGTPTKIKTLKGWVIGQSASAGANGRLAFGSHRYPDYIAAFDVDEERLIFAAGPRIAPAPAAQTPQVLLSASGKALLGGSSRCIWNVDGGPPIWVGSSHETPQAVESNEQFMVVEAWHNLWAEWLPNLKFETRAFRRLDDGELLYRTYADQIPYASHTNAPGTLVHLSDGTIHRMPPPIDWPLLALCQAILALPLVLMWAGLRGRRMRRLRLGSATP